MLCQTDRNTVGPLSSFLIRLQRFYQTILVIVSEIIRSCLSGSERRTRRHYRCKLQMNRPALKVLIYGFSLVKHQHVCMNIYWYIPLVRSDFYTSSLWHVSPLIRKAAEPGKRQEREKALPQLCTWKWFTALWEHKLMAGNKEALFTVWVLSSFAQRD